MEKYQRQLNTLNTPTFGACVDNWWEWKCSLPEEPKQAKGAGLKSDPILQAAHVRADKVEMVANPRYNTGERGGLLYSEPSIRHLLRRPRPILFFGLHSVPDFKIAQSRSFDLWVDSRTLKQRENTM